MSVTVNTPRASYYASLPEYYHAEELRMLLSANDTTSHDLITFIKNHKLPVNTFIKGLRPNEWIPLIHACCHSSKYQDAVKFLIKNGANLHLLPDAEPEVIEPLLFSCDMLYFKFLYDAGCRIPTTDQSHNIKRRLRCADVKRLNIMLKLKIMSINDILTATEDPILYCLKSMKEYLVYAFNIRKGVPSLQIELTNTIEKFMQCIVYLLKWNAPVSQDTVNYCIEFYIYEVLNLPELKLKLKLKNLNLNLNAPLYHEYKDSLTVAMLRPLLNDARYEKTCIALDVKPNSELYALCRI